MWNIIIVNWMIIRQIFFSSVSNYVSVQHPTIVIILFFFIVWKALKPNFCVNPRCSYLINLLLPTLRELDCRITSSGNFAGNKIRIVISMNHDLHRRRSPGTFTSRWRWNRMIPWILLLFVMVLNRLLDELNALPDGTTLLSPRSPDKLRNITVMLKVSIQFSAEKR